MMAVTKLMVLTRTVAWLSALIIIVLSVVADNMRPRVMADDRCEHFAAYFIAGSLLAISYSRPRQLLSNGIVLAICAGVLEIAQSWIPGRTSSAGDFVASTFGAWIAIVLIGVLRRARDSIAAVSLPKWMA